jgi:hypothetical protein
MMKLGFCALCVGLIFYGSSCIVENNRPKLDSSNIELALDAPADAEVTPTPEDIKCFADNECHIIEKGCCYHEKSLSVNKERSQEILQQIRNKCRELRRTYAAEKQKEQAAPHFGDFTTSRIADLCAGRTGSQNWLGAQEARCKKEVQEPNLDKLKKEISDPVELNKKFEEAELLWRQAAGTCTIVSTGG